MLNYIDKIFEIIFPDNCLGCKKEGKLICEKCLNEVESPEETPEHVFARFSYKNHLVREALWLLKYNRRQGVAKIFAPNLKDLLLEIVSEENSFGKYQNPVLIAIPSSKIRKFSRGYNQAEVLAKALAEVSGYKLNNTSLVKIKSKESQVSQKNKKARLRNMIGVFDVSDKNLVTGQDIFLIDDITTTGATLSEARKVLIKAGARSVIGVTVAH